MIVSATVYKIVKIYITRWSSKTTCFDRHAVIIRSIVEIQKYTGSYAPTWGLSGVTYV